MQKQDISLLIKDDDYMLDLCVRMAHHSTAIEGNALNQDEVASIVLDGYISKQISEREFYEVRNYKEVLPLFIKSLKDKMVLDSALIKEFHSIIMKDLLYNRGEFKSIDNVIVGSTLETTKPYLVPTKIKDMCDNLYFRLAGAKSEADKLSAILEAHIDFEKIHPFSDGNGRVGRLLMVYACLKQNLVPIIIPKEQKNRYTSILRANDIKGFLDFGKEIQGVEKEHCEIFLKNALMKNFDKELKNFIDKKNILTPSARENKANAIIEDYQSLKKRGIEFSDKQKNAINSLCKMQGKNL